MWNSEQYLKFKTQRTQPAIDLLSRISLTNPDSIIDIGCGPANSTAILYNRYPNAYILGVDSSQNMIDMAKSTYPNLDFLLCDAKDELTTLNKKFDIVFSNACIQWVPNHSVILKNMFSLLNDGGVMAIQIPMNYDEPIHKIIHQVSNSSKWKSKLSNVRTFYTLKPYEYYDLLSGLTDDFDIWSTTYYHVMSSHNDIMEWYRGTGLRPYLESLSVDDRTSFESEVYDRLLQEYPKQKDGNIIFKFPRYFMLATK